jgi:branched-chain amino acid transport system substrate-binding protein
MKPVSIVASAVALALGLAPACRKGDPKPEAATLRVGVVAPFFTTPGEGIRNGVAMAVSEINAAGGVAGKPLQVVEVDDQFSADKATLAYQRLAAEDKVVAVVGFAGSGIFAVMEQLSRFGVPVLGTGVGADKLSEMVARDPQRYGCYFRVMHRSSELAQVTSDFLRGYLHGRLGLTRFAILVEDDIWTKYLRDEWKHAIAQQPGARLVFEDTFSPTTTDFLAIFGRIRASRAEYVLDASSRVSSALYLKAWRQVEGPLIGAVPTGAGTTKYYDEVGPDGTGVFTVGVIPAANNPLTPRAAEWHARYASAYGDAEYTSAYSYDAVYILKDALLRAGDARSEALSQALERTDHVGVMGRYVFDNDHHPRFGEGYRVINMLQYQQPSADGYRVVWPESRASAEFVAPSWWKGATPATPERARTRRPSGARGGQSHEPPAHP